jgi:hypothetical protein
MMIAIGNNPTLALERVTTHHTHGDDVNNENMVSGNRSYSPRLRRKRHVQHLHHRNDNIDNDPDTDTNTDTNVSTSQALSVKHQAADLTGPLHNTLRNRQGGKERNNSAPAAFLKQKKVGPNPNAPSVQGRTTTTTTTITNNNNNQPTSSFYRRSSSEVMNLKSLESKSNKQHHHQQQQYRQPSFMKDTTTATTSATASASNNPQQQQQQSIRQAPFIANNKSYPRHEPTTSTSFKKAPFIRHDTMNTSTNDITATAATALEEE